MIPVLFLVGATASGKKAVARAVAEPLQAELLSLDALKVYQGMDHGTDKSRDIRFGLTDLVDPSETWSAGRYVACARKEVERIRGEGRRPLFVGGTGLYLRALVRGFFEGPPVTDEVREGIQRELADQGSEVLHQRLETVDPASARRIHPRDARRVGRALEVHRQTGRPLSNWQRDHTRLPFAGPFVMAGLRHPPGVLRRRMADRVQRMLREGLVEEVRALLASGRMGRVAAEAIGYREVQEHLEGSLAEEDLAERILTHTWQFSRRQENWFRQFPEIRWVDVTSIEQAAHDMQEVLQTGIDESQETPPGEA